MISHLLCAARGVEGAHRFSFFAHEVAMLIACGDVQQQEQSSKTCSRLADDDDSCQTNWASNTSPDSWLQRIDLKLWSSSKLPIQIGTNRSNGRHRRPSQRDGSGFGPSL